jgi:hypothetical protein
VQNLEGSFLITCPGRDLGFFYRAIDASRCKRLQESVEATFMGEAVTTPPPPPLSLSLSLSLSLHARSVCICVLLFLLYFYFYGSFLELLLFEYAALDSDDLLYLKEQMEAEEDAERLLRRTEKRAFAAFKISYFVLEGGAILLV